MEICETSGRCRTIRQQAGEVGGVVANFPKRFHLVLRSVFVAGPAPAEGKGRARPRHPRPRLGETVGS
jgi:hypothetical protein